MQVGWAPSDSFKEFLNSSFHQNLSSSQVFKVLEETALPDMDIFVTPKLDNSLADQISPNYRKTAENRDRGLSKVQRAHFEHSCSFDSLTRLT